ncbi:pilin [Amycolatopsis sp. cmx-11-32]|uniref:pilin n=1 Tax=Amycolatopsis sp. cmx-11-32 TaxID=2785796 RepID=UPI0039E58587
MSPTRRVRLRSVTRTAPGLADKLRRPASPDAAKSGVRGRGTRLSGHTCQHRTSWRHNAPACPTLPAARRTNTNLLQALWLLLAGLLLTGSAASAETVHVVALARTLDEVLDNIREWIMGILAGIAVVFLSIGGLRYLMASGDPGEIEKAKGAFKAAGIGFGLAALAPIVVEILKGIVGGV